MTRLYYYELPRDKYIGEAGTTPVAMNSLCNAVSSERRNGPKNGIMAAVGHTKALKTLYCVLLRQQIGRGRNDEMV
jgi:hypothetical protein